MTSFRYQAVDSSGNRTTGSVDARDRSDALRQLSAAGLQTLELGQEGKAGKQSASASGTEQKATPKLSALNRIRLTGSQLIAFTEELSDLLNAGIQLEPSLKLMEGRKDLVAVGKVAAQIRAEIRDGVPLSRALERVSNSFDSLYVNLVAAGEASGTLPKLLTRHTLYLIRIQELKSKLATALIYPAFLLLAGMAVTVLFISFLIPRLTVLIESTGSSLPGGVQLIARSSELVKSHWWMFLIGLVVFWLLFKMITSHPANRPVWDRIKLRLPLVGKLILIRFQVHFLRTLGNLLENGLSLVDSLKLSYGITGNLHLRSELKAITDEVVDGSSLHGSLRKHKCFPDSLADYVRINEQTGSLDQGILRAADRSERTLEKNIERVSAMIQPVIIVAMAGVIGMMAYTMISVIYDTIEILRSR